ncbi:MAG: hypothetical protein MPJ50_13295, partial [Pirellulales bacterium]|nr:hypothetical protein [Pirellulales bacterium]
MEHQPISGERDSAPRPLRKWRKRIFRFVLLSIITSVITWTVNYSIWLYNAQKRRDTAIAEARKRGEPVWFSDLKPEPLLAAELSLGALTDIIA